MNGAPLGHLLGYVFVGTICFATMVFLFAPFPGTRHLTSYHRFLSVKWWLFYPSMVVSLSSLGDLLILSLLLQLVGIAGINGW